MVRAAEAKAFRLRFRLRSLAHRAWPRLSKSSLAN